MNKKQARITVSDIREFKYKMLDWASRFNIFCFFDNNSYSTAKYECLLAIGSIDSVLQHRTESTNLLQDFSLRNKGKWIFGHLGYDAFEQGKNDPEFSDVNFPDRYFFVPEIVLTVSGNLFTVYSEILDANNLLNQICSHEIIDPILESNTISIQTSNSFEQYESAINAVKKHIQQGDCYVLNYCQHFFATHASMNPLASFNQLNNISPNPYSVFYRLNATYALCASPERFLMKSGNTLMSQPIKGTRRRNLSNPEIDEHVKKELLENEKERTENAMIVDLVRNDLSKVCTPGSVTVSEFRGVYSFPQVHQAISTIEGDLKPNLDWTEILESCFPMGSMTGAPKKRVMELIRLYETQPRGLFSGTIGFVDPDGDFDFNVVIRTLFYDATQKVLSFKTGGGITAKSDIKEEFDECNLKAEAIISVLNTTRNA